MANIKEEIKAFLRSGPVFAGLLPDALDDDSDLVRTGALDSIGVFSLVEFLEDNYKIKVEPQDLTEANFRSLLAIEAFVQKRQS